MTAEPTKHTDERAHQRESDPSPADPLLRLRKQARLRRIQGELSWTDGQDRAPPDEVAGHA